jgi:uroporphyrin-III C-methyltransferase/precorrin-2 dehydrogenase/sirohydrochlorin ferrochelatase
VKFSRIEPAASEADGGLLFFRRCVAGAPLRAFGKPRALAMDLFPFFLKLQGRSCLVVGAGKVAEGKIESLVRCGASVRVVAPAATIVIRKAAEEGRIVWEQRTFLPSDLAGIFLVIAATPFAELHEQIFQQARRDGILCNAVDEPERCDFYYPAVLRRGSLQIAVSTGGRAPLIAQRLRQELELQFGPEYGLWIEAAGHARDELMARNISPEERREVLAELSSEHAFRNFRNGNAVPVHQESELAGGKVYFVGAGPGDPELLTRKAWTILGAAEVVLHDALVPSEILRLASPAAVISDVGKRCGQKAIRQEEIHALLIGYALEGRIVVRLQGGDPLIFGRAGEEVTALRNAGIDFEIVPGITAASAAAAAAGIPLTDRRLASKLIFLSAHRRHADHGAVKAMPVAETRVAETAAKEVTADWKLLPAADTTLAIYMPGSDYGRVAHDLFEAGWASDAPCLVVSHASTPHQSIARMDLGSLAHATALPAPALVIVGEVVTEGGTAVGRGAADRAVEPVGASK